MGTSNQTAGTQSGEHKHEEKGYLYLAGIASVTGGLAIGVLDAAGITTDAGGSSGAIYTSIYLAIMMVCAALTVPHTARVAARFGIERAYRGVIALGTFTWSIAGLLIIAGVPGLPVLLCFAPIFGFTAGLSGVMAPIFSKAYITGKDMAGAYARMSVVSGIAWAIGSAGGGFLLYHADMPGLGLLLKALFGVPFFVILVKVRPSAKPTEPKASKRAFPEMRERLKTNEGLRRATALRCGIAFFAVPMVSLIVPIVDALRQTPLLPGAGIVVAAMAFGQLASPWLVGRLSRDERPQIQGAALAAMGAAGMLAIYGIVSAVISKRPELAAWTLVGLGFGGLRYAARALNIGAVTATGSEEESTNLLQASQFATTLVSPVGVLIWGMLVNRVSPEAAIFYGAAGTLLVAAYSLRGSKRRAAA